MKPNLRVERLVTLKWVMGACVILFLWMGTGQPSPAAGVSAEQQVKQRAEARWAALVEGDFHRAYEFESPAYRKVTSLERFRSHFGNAVKWRGAQVTKVTIGTTGATADVIVVLDYTSILPSGQALPGRRGLKEKWFRTDGQWWLARE